ncbi:DUF4124 domain-containing protein [uncultured Paraglaciecola sp.]|uniref:DUF4124 domain-containing protein n=1 Tax=uncultured Paraglaciecola sp. TaxID=1765024 RepID=UPI00260A70BF|nr:DUF4124 domain-containing protein [uncultured Paraglaciecola sp.]
MWVRYFLFFILINLLGTFAVAQSNQVYKWTDEFGVTHLSQYPPEDKGDNLKVEKVQVFIPTTELTKEKSNKARIEKINQYFDQRKTAKQTQLQASKAAQTDKENCTLARNNLKLYQSGQRIRTRADANSEPQVLTEKERAKRIERSEKNIQSYC